MADGAVVRNLLQVVDGPEPGGLGPLGYIEQGFDEGGHGQVLVPWMEKEILLGIEGGAQGLAFSASDAFGDHGEEILQGAVSQDPGLQFQKIKGGGVDAVDDIPVPEFFGIHNSLGVHLIPVG